MLYGFIEYVKKNIILIIPDSSPQIVTVQHIFYVDPGAYW